MTGTCIILFVSDILVHEIDSHFIRVTTTRPLKLAWVKGESTSSHSLKNFTYNCLQNRTTLRALIQNDNMALAYKITIAHHHAN